MFDKGFLIGTATAPHQVEGNNIHSDCWAMENIKHTTYVDKSGLAVDHYNRYEEDMLLMKQAGYNAYRFGIEWARIQPREDFFDQKEIEHYARMIDFCRQCGLEPIVTLHHFSSPAWTISKGGWEAESIVEDFAKYVEYTMRNLGGRMNWVCTINEANMRLQMTEIENRFKTEMMKQAQVSGNIQMGVKLETMLSNMKAAAAEYQEAFGVAKPANFQSSCTPHGDELVMKAHIAAKAVIRRLCPGVKVGLTLSLHDVQYVEGGEESARQKWEDEYIHYLPAIEDDDFLGVQNYTRTVFDSKGVAPVPQGAELTQHHYEFYPEGLEHVLRKVAEQFKGELLVTENGIATLDDSRRIAFVEQALSGVGRCIADGIPVKGYCYWSLMDNFEWQLGFEPQFGLVAIDRATMKRTPKPSFAFLGAYARN